jgi:undecaprenyl diphosphate synthase
MATPKTKIPAHIGIILDGNRRWARSQGLPPLEGHRRGLDNVKIIARQAFKRGVAIMTIFAFSTENWRRDKKEVSYLMGLFRIFIKREVASLAREGVRVRFFGRLSDFDAGMRLEMKRAEKETKNGLKGQLNVCLSYGGRDEVVRALKKVIKTGKRGREISESLISQNLDSAGLPDPDLIIRTSGEQRLSGFLTWQSVYSELYFTKKHWPAFSPRDLDLALRDYAKRQRRFGAN